MKITSNDGKHYSVWKFLLVLFPSAIIRSFAVFGAVLWGLCDEVDSLLRDWAKVKEKNQSDG